MSAEVLWDLGFMGPHDENPVILEMRYKHTKVRAPASVTHRHSDSGGWSRAVKGSCDDLHLRKDVPVLGQSHQDPIYTSAAGSPVLCEIMEHTCNLSI